MSDDLTDKMDISGGLEETEEETDHLNNVFYFTPKDFVKTCNSVNGDTRHQVTYTAVWKAIDTLLGHEEICTNRKDGNVVWKVISSHSVVQDDFNGIRGKKENPWLKTTYWSKMKTSSTITITVIKAFGHYGQVIWKTI